MEGALKKTKKACEFLDIVNDVLRSIFKLLPVETVVALRATCTKLRGLGGEDLLWAYLAQRDFPVSGGEDVYQEEYAFERKYAGGLDVDYILNWHRVTVADIRCCLRRGGTPLIRGLENACAYGDFEEVKLLLEHVGPTSSCLRSVVVSGNEKLLLYFLKKKMVCPNKVFYDACRANLVDVATVMIEYLWWDEHIHAFAIATQSAYLGHIDIFKLVVRHTQFGPLINLDNVTLAILQRNSRALEWVQPIISIN